MLSDLDSNIKNIAPFQFDILFLTYLLNVICSLRHSVLLFCMRKRNGIHCKNDKGTRFNGCAFNNCPTKLLIDQMFWECIFILL